MFRNTVKILLLSAVVINLSGCGLFARVLNPFYEPPTEEALRGVPNDHALNDGEERIQRARAALEQTATYERTLPPQPIKPVIKPAVVRLMWIPDHLNKSGDLIPAHYYYLKVKGDSFAATDAFEVEGQLNKGKGESTAIPFVTDGR